MPHAIADIVQSLNESTGAEIVHVIKHHTYHTNIIGKWESLSVKPTQT